MSDPEDTVYLPAWWVCVRGEWVEAKAFGVRRRDDGQLVAATPAEPEVFNAWRDRALAAESKQAELTETVKALCEDHEHISSKLARLEGLERAAREYATASVRAGLIGEPRKSLPDAKRALLNHATAYAVNDSAENRP